jgi:hypothetical protein
MLGKSTAASEETDSVICMAGVGLIMYAPRGG